MSRNVEEFEKKVKQALEKGSLPQGNPQEVVNKLLAIAKRKGATPSQPPPA